MPSLASEQPHRFETSVFLVGLSLALLHLFPLVILPFLAPFEPARLLRVAETSGGWAILLLLGFAAFSSVLFYWFRLAIRKPLPIWPLVAVSLAGAAYVLWRYRANVDHIVTMVAQAGLRPNLRLLGEGASEYATARATGLLGAGTLLNVTCGIMAFTPPKGLETAVVPRMPRAGTTVIAGLGVLAPAIVVLVASRVESAAALLLGIFAAAHAGILIVLVAPKAGRAAVSSQGLRAISLYLLALTLWYLSAQSATSASLYRAIGGEAVPDDEVVNVAAQALRSQRWLIQWLPLFGLGPLMAAIVVLPARGGRLRTSWHGLAFATASALLLIGGARRADAHTLEELARAGHEIVPPGLELPRLAERTEYHFPRAKLFITKEALIASSTDLEPQTIAERAELEGPACLDVGVKLGDFRYQRWTAFADTSVSVREAVCLLIAQQSRYEGSEPVFSHQGGSPRKLPWGIDAGYIEQGADPVPWALRRNAPPLPAPYDSLVPQVGFVHLSLALRDVPTKLRVEPDRWIWEAGAAPKEHRGTLQDRKEWLLRILEALPETRSINRLLIIAAPNIPLAEVLAAGVVLRRHEFTIELYVPGITTLLGPLNVTVSDISEHQELQIQSTLEQHVDVFQGCAHDLAEYDDLLDPRSFTVRLLIGSDGHVSHVMPSSTLPAHIQQCILRALYKISFPKPKVELVRATIELTFGLPVGM